MKHEATQRGLTFAQITAIEMGLDPHSPVVSLFDAFHGFSIVKDWKSTFLEPEFRDLYDVAQASVSWPTDWDSRCASYMPIAEAFAKRSKDESSKVGAVILDSNMTVRAQGWNGAARGSSADEDLRFQRPEKYRWSIHAEQNAIANAARVGVPLNGCVLVVTHPPCMVCSNLIAASGINTVIARKPTDDFFSRWRDDLVRSKVLFREVGVRLVFVGDDNVPITG